jgi:hypothetical protein
MKMIDRLDHFGRYTSKKYEEMLLMLVNAQIKIENVIYNKKKLQMDRFI